MQQEKLASVLDAPEAVDEGKEYETKTCPRCGSVLFADMDVCYGCLFDFTRSSLAPSLPGMPALSELPSSAVQLPEFESSPEGLAAHEPYPEASEEESIDSVIGAASDVGELEQEADATIQLGRNRNTLAGLAVRVSLPDLSVVLPLPEKGLLLGREETNDIVLRQRTVSRHHLRLYPSQAGVVCEDLGATNPALVAGAALGGTCELPIGTQLDVCGARLTLIRDMSVVG